MGVLGFCPIMPVLSVGHKSKQKNVDSTGPLEEKLIPSGQQEEKLKLRRWLVADWQSMTPPCLFWDARGIQDQILYGKVLEHLPVPQPVILQCIHQDLYR